MAEYWSRFIGGRIARRRALQAVGGGGVAVAALGLLGCGSGSSASKGSGGTKDGSGLLAQKADSSKQAYNDNMS